MKRLLVFSIFLLLSGSIYAQETYTSSGRRLTSFADKKKREERFVDRLVVGGGLGLSFGTYTDISLAPKIGYKITDNFAVGISLGYEYWREKGYYPISATLSYDAKANFFTTGVWARYAIWKGFFAHAEYQQNFSSYSYPNYDPNGSGNIIYLKENFNTPSLLVGPGYRQWAGEHVSLNVSLLYDVLQNPKGPYYGQIIPVFDILWHF